MNIRPFKPADAEALAQLYHAAVHQVGIRDYSASQVAVWSPAPRMAEAYIAQAAGRIFLVAVDDAGEPVGYGDLEPDGHIDHLYCRPDHVGTGIGSRIYIALEAAARRAGIGFLFVEASEAARRMFERHGFQVDHRRDFEVEGVPIHNYRMTKTLAPKPDRRPPPHNRRPPERG